MLIRFGNIPECIGGQVITNDQPGRAVPFGAAVSLTAYTTGELMTGLIIRERGKINQEKSWMITEEAARQ